MRELVVSLLNNMVFLGLLSFALTFVPIIGIMLVHSNTNSIKDDENSLL